MSNENLFARVTQESSNAVQTAASSRKRKKNIPLSIRKQRAIERATKNSAAWAALQKSIQNHKAEIKLIAEEHGVSAKTLKQKALHVTAIARPRKSNIFNAFQRFRKIDLANHKFAMSEEQRSTLLELQQLPRDEGYSVLERANDDVKDIIRLIHDQFRMNKVANSRGSRKSVGQSFRRSCERISSELESLSSRCKTTAICMVVRASTAGTHDPFVYTDNISKDYFEKVKNLNVNMLAEQYEGHAIQGISSASKSNSTGRRLAKKTEVRELVRSGLRDITGDEKATMSWSKYESAIVGKYNVKLVGWPSDLTFDIDGMSSTDLQEIISGLKSGNIRWESVPLDTNADTPSTTAKRRKRRCDKGVRRAPYKKRRALGTITNTKASHLCTDESDSDSDSDSDSESDSDTDTDNDEN